ncbi:LPXTG cell wall anchor domain-containing protein [Asanoa siamensis]
MPATGSDIFGLLTFGIAAVGLGAFARWRARTRTELG